MERVILVHHHIFKNAGTSFNYALKSYFGERFFEFDLPGSKVVTEDILDKFIVEHPNASVVSSHHACMPTPSGKDYRTVSSVLLRRPLARVRSIYEFERKQQAQTPGAIHAKELSFKKYVLWRLEKSPAVFANYQTHYCSRTGNQGPQYGSTEEDLKVATQNLRNCFLVGVVEQYEDSLALVQHKLCDLYPGVTLKSACLNTTSKAAESYESLRISLVKDLGDDLVRRLEEVNQLDERLYKLAYKILSQQLSAYNIAA